jgi:hypothetical protein
MGPRILLVGANGELASRAKRAASRVDASVDTTELTTAEEQVKASRPHVIVMPNAVYGWCPSRMEAMAERARAVLVTVDDGGLEHGELEILFSAAMAAAEQRRQGPCEPEGERAPAPSHR